MGDIGIYSPVGVSVMRQQRALSSAFPCPVNRVAAVRQLLTSSAGIMEIQPGYDVLYFYNAR